MRVVFRTVAMPVRKMTKAMLEVENKRLRRERNQARQELVDRKVREKNANESISRSHSQLELTCSAMNLVTQWERDPKMDEKDKMIAELRAEIEKKNQEIAGLRRGDGAVGEVLLRVEGSRVSNARREALLALRSPVYATFAMIHGATSSLRDSLGLPR